MLCYQTNYNKHMPIFHLEWLDNETCWKMSKVLVVTNIKDRGIYVINYKLYVKGYKLLHLKKKLYWELY